MSNDYNIIKCPHCQEIQFDYGQEYCNFCHKKLIENIFDNIFGDDNPFDKFGVT
jgi:hypothetical protein